MHSKIPILIPAELTRKQSQLDNVVQNSNKSLNISTKEFLRSEQMIHDSLF